VERRIRENKSSHRLTYTIVHRDLQEEEFSEIDEDIVCDEEEQDTGGWVL